MVKLLGGVILFYQYFINEHVENMEEGPRYCITNLTLLKHRVSVNGERTESAFTGNKKRLQS